MRGKHSVAAERRRSGEQLTTDLATYQRRVRDLTAELKAEKDARKADAQAFRADIRILKAQLREGVSAEVAALEAQNRSLRTAADRAKTNLRLKQDSIDRTFLACAGVLKDFGIVRDGMEALSLLVGVGKSMEAYSDAPGTFGLSEMGTFLVSDAHVKGDFDAAAVVERAQGRRTADQIVADFRRRLGAAAAS
jgi:hypothetical protein